MRAAHHSLNSWNSVFHPKFDRLSYKNTKQRLQVKPFGVLVSIDIFVSLLAETAMLIAARMPNGLT